MVRNLPGRPIQSYSSLGARIEAWLLRLAGAILRRYSYRGIGTLSRFFGNGPFNPGNHVVVGLFARSHCQIDLGDYYWSRLLFADFEYEPEVARVLRSHLKPHCIFLDLGANIGFWSIFASETIPDPKRIVAVEAGGVTFARLRRNAEINNAPFTVVRAAIAEKAGETVTFVTAGGHAGARIAGTDEAITDLGRAETVETSSIDALLAGIGPDDGAPVVIKLDVEGAEVSALMGATETLQRANIIIIYEDHGADMNCTVSRHIIDELGFDVYMIDHAGAPEKATLEAIAASKTDPLKGYNYVAVPPGVSFALG